ncbi:hypothetical protein JHK85_051104 [Glycine max]|nr:hypothetical protein JHK85_051104 [Glycine max]
MLSLSHCNCHVDPEPANPQSPVVNPPSSPELEVVPPSPPLIIISDFPSRETAAPHDSPAGEVADPPDSPVGGAADLSDSSSGEHHRIAFHESQGCYLKREANTELDDKKRMRELIMSGAPYRNLS